MLGTITSRESGKTNGGDMGEQGELSFNELMELADMDVDLNLEEACTWRVSLTDQPDEVGFPCKNCGHTMLVHGGVHNQSLMGCVICEMLIAIRRLEPASRTVEDHQPFDHSGGRELPSPTLRSMRCLTCNGRLVPNFDETGWMHQRVDNVAADPPTGTGQVLASPPRKGW